MEQWRESINWFLIEVNRFLYDWRVGLADFWNQSTNKSLIVLLLALAISIVFLFRRERRGIEQLSLFRRVSQVLAGASASTALASSLFEILFKLIPAPAACLYLAASPEGPFLLKAKQPNPTPSVPQLDWDPEPLLTSIPEEPGIIKKGALAVFSLPVTIEGQKLALIQFPISRWEEAHKIGKRAAVIASLVTPIVAQFSASERTQRFEEQAREASVVSGSSQMLLSTTLAPDQLASLLLDLATRSTESHAGLILIHDTTSHQRGLQVLASTALEPHFLQELSAAAQDGTVLFPAEGAIVTSLESRSRFASILLKAGFQSLLQVPIAADATPLGSLILLRRDGAFGANNLRICQMNATRLALSLKNRIYHEAVFGEYRETLKAIVRTLESSSPYLEDHASRLSWVAGDMARALVLSDNEVEGIRLAAELHDVGMVGVDNEILFKAGRLTSKEYDLVKYHPMIGAALTAPIQLPIPIAPIILHHHERYDGFGYPSGLKGSEIPLGARILALGEAFDTMVTSRSYRQALAFSDAVARLQAHAGTQLDPQIVELFIRRVTPEVWQTITRKDSLPPQQDHQKNLD